MKRGFTLVEIMIVVAIIGLLTTMAIPAFIQYRADTRDRLCQRNLSLIQHSKSVYAIKMSLTGADPVTLANCQPYIKGGAVLSCPDGGNYAVTTVDADPTCSLGGEHTLP